MTHYIFLPYYYGQESLRGNGVALTVNKRVRNAALGCTLERMISIRFQGKPFNTTVIQVYALSANADEDEVEQFYGGPIRPSRTNAKKRCPFHHRGLECTSRRSGDTWSNRQVWPWSTK